MSSNLLLLLQLLNFTAAAYVKTNQGLTTVPGDIPATETHIYLGDNDITAINSDLDHLTNVQQLSLTRNKLSQFPNMAAYGATITHLWLDDNLITLVPENLLVHLDSITELYLNKNQINVFPNFTPIGNTLILLGMGKTGLTSLTPSDVTPLARLEKLYLSDNELPIFPDICPVGNTLTILSLHRNKIQVVPAPRLDCLVKLQTLKLIGRKYAEGLTELPDVPGPGNTLVELWLHDNRFTTMPMMAKLGKSLKKLMMAHNYYLSSIETKHLEPLHSLTTFEVFANNLQYVPDLTPIADTLQKAEISRWINSPIESIGPKEMAALNGIPEVYLEKTQLTYLPPTCFDKPTTLYLADSPVDLCSCDMLWLKEAQGGGILILHVTDIQCPGASQLWTLLSFEELKSVCGAPQVAPGAECDIGMYHLKLAFPFTWIFICWWYSL